MIRVHALTPPVPENNHDANVAVPTREALAKLALLREILGSLGSAAVAFSAGVDSSLLLKVARDELGGRACAISVCAPIFPERELLAARSFCEAYGVEHLVVSAFVLESAAFCANQPDRCYICKHSLFETVQHAAAEHGCAWVLEGSNKDDEHDYRPGLRALAELGIRSPLREARLEKHEIRSLAHYLGLECWNKPSSACLASRFAYGEHIDEGKLAMVDKAEQVLRDCGFEQVRVRVHASLARIEVPACALSRVCVPETRSRIAAELHACGFTYVALDIDGYRSGAMNEAL